jgi:subtilisin
VLSIGAFGSNNRVADFSSSQRFTRAVNPLVPDLVAPGVGILSCVPDGEYAEMDGTSMATPHMAGLAALLLQGKPDASADQLEKAILDSCTLPASMPEERANRGVPDAVQAFAALTGGPLPAAAAAAVRPTVAGARSARGVLAARSRRGRVAAKTG